jgi:uncharacterized membrane protein
VTHTRLRIVQFVNIFLFALITGVFWGTWFSLSRSIAAIRPETFLEIGHTMIVNLARPMSILMPAALICCAILIVMLRRDRHAGGLYLAIASFVLMVVALVITLTVNVPIDGEINQWTVGTLPADWMAIRDRWEFYHALRTFASLGSFGCAVASALRWISSLDHADRVA